MKFRTCSLFLACILFTLTANAGGLGDRLGNLFVADNASQAADEILDPEIAFQFFPVAYADKQLEISWIIEPGYYLYRDKLTFSSEDADVSLGEFNMPVGKSKDDPVFGQVQVYYSGNKVIIPIDSRLKEIPLTINFQGCKEDAVCYPPISKVYSVSVESFSSLGGTLASNNNLTEMVQSISTQDEITHALTEQTLLFNILTFFGFGFLLALTPCVFPMIPILSGIIVGQGNTITRIKAISLSSVYVIVMALTYSLLGILAALFSINLQATSQDPVVLSVFSLIFVLLAMSMFGFYQLQLPASWQSKLMYNESQSGTLKSAAVMGALSALIVGPCIAPPLAGALLYISQTGDALLGGLALFAMGLGSGVPLLAVGVSSGELLPRAGPWMESIKEVFGVIMLGVAIWFMERVLPASVVLILWALLFVTTAIFMGALDKLDASHTAWLRVRKGLAIVLLVYGSVLIVGSTIGNGTLLRPIQLQALQQGTTSSLQFEYVSSIDGLNAALAQASFDGQYVMLDYYADWCLVCNELEHDTFPDASVQQALTSFKLLKIDVTQNTEADKQLLKSHQLFGPPAILFYNKQGKEIISHRLIGFVNAKEFLLHISEVKAI